MHSLNVQIYLATLPINYKEMKKGKTNIFIADNYIHANLHRYIDLATFGILKEQFILLILAHYIFLYTV